MSGPGCRLDLDACGRIVMLAPSREIACCRPPRARQGLAVEAAPILKASKFTRRGTVISVFQKGLQPDAMLPQNRSRCPWFALGSPPSRVKEELRLNSVGLCHENYWFLTSIFNITPACASVQSVIV